MTVVATQSPIAVPQKVQDVYLAAYFHALDFELIRIESTRPNSKFYFAAVPDGKEFDYYNSATEEVGARRFFESFKTMRSLSTHVEFMDDGLVGIRDIYLAGYLYYKEHKIVRVERTSFQCRFVFTGVTMEQILHFYNQGVESLQVKKLMQAFRNVRDLAAYTDRDEPVP